MSYRLPRTILPSSYHIEIHPDLDSHTFRGLVTAGCTVVEATTELRCNTADLELSEVMIDGERVEFTIDEGSEQLVIEFDEVRQPGPVVFSAQFSGELDDSLKGFYRSTFTDDEGAQHTIATTQFQSTDARRAFPCWDEPDMKATFAVTLVVDPELTAVSNGAELERTPRNDGKVAIAFAETMKMSTYLVAFVVGPLEISEPAYHRDVPIRIVHRPGQGHLTDFALEAAVHALGYFEDYYGIPYPTDKLDMIALPDFAMGAMENLGCVTYREILLLVDPDTATQPELQNVADVINHELAHMWFGDLVTMGWWNGIWLNEAFATFMEMKCTDDFRPEWMRWTSFGISRSAAFDIDSLEATRPIEFDVHSPEDAEAMFDLLTYEKGAAVVRMLEQWLGEETFRTGIRLYLDTHSYANTETHHLWDALEEVSGHPVTAAMETWIFQGGYPVIEATAEGLHQRRFTYTGEGDAQHWSVPVQLRTVGGNVQTIELHEQSAPLEVAVDEVATYNNQGNGFYRVKVPSEQLVTFGDEGVGDLAPVERFGLLDDSWSLTLAGEVGLADYLALTRGYADETDVSVWQKLVSSLGFIDHVASDGDREGLGALTDELIAGARERLGAEPGEAESPRVSQLRGTLFNAAGTLTPHGSQTRSEAISSARALLDAENPDAELRSAAVKIVAANGTESDFESFKADFERAETPQDEIRNLYALPGFPEGNQIETVVTMALDGEIRTQNAPFVLAQALMNREHGPMVWEMIQSGWDGVNERFPSNTIVRMLTGVRWLTTPETVASVHAFFEGRVLPQGQKQLDQHLERLRVNGEFRSRVRSDLGAALPAL